MIGEILDGFGGSQVLHGLMIDIGEDLVIFRLGSLETP
jgi:hypothetical protein